MDKNRNASRLWLAQKYLKSKSSGWISRDHYLTLAGILLGVTALICVNSVMNGFRADIRQRIIGSTSEIRISKAGNEPLGDSDALIRQLEAKGFAAAPMLRNELVIRRGSVITPTVCFGIDPALQAKVSDALSPPRAKPGAISQGLLVGNVQGHSFAEGGIALGSTLAMKLDATLGDEVQLMSPLFNVPTAFGLIPRVRTARVAAIFYAGMPQYDETFSYVPLDLAGFFGGEGSGYLQVKTPDFDRAELYARQLRAELPGYQVEDWSSFDSSLYGAIRFEKYMMFVIMLFMYVIASFNLTGNLLKAIVQKKRELGLLKALGYTERDLRRLFLYQSLILSALGIIAGILLASLLIWLQQRFGLITLDMGESGRLPLPIRVFWQDYLVVVLASLAITVLSVLLPLNRLKRINPIELIRQTA